MLRKRNPARAVRKSQRVDNRMAKNHSLNWLSKRPQTKEAHLAAIASIIGGKRNIDTDLLDQAGARRALPLVLISGANQSSLLEVPIHIPNSVFALVKDLKEFQTDFTPAALDVYLRRHITSEI